MDRREVIKLGMGMSAASLAPLRLMAREAHWVSNRATEVEQFGVFEIVLEGPSNGNPFKDVHVSARFTNGTRSVAVPGFYDGKGVYRVRFMPDLTGQWSYETTSSAAGLNGVKDSFEVTPKSEGNHGPVQVAHQFHFAHADGTTYFPFGTTCYALGFVDEAVYQMGLADLKKSGFNKVRMCLLPKALGDAPIPMPFLQSGASEGAHPAMERDGKKHAHSFDLHRPDPAYFQMVERRIQDLGALGIQADVILFHPYDSWGFRSMSADADDQYLRYAIARLSAYRNVWFSIANEYDLIKEKTMADWDRFFHITQEADPSGHLRSIHHSHAMYDYAKSWCTHASLQTHDFEKTGQRHKTWGKPVIYDEVQYEGNIARRWGNLSPDEMTRRIWLAVIFGGYATHGETYIVPPGETTWSDFGRLRGASAPRIAFLESLLYEIGTEGLSEFENAYYFSAGKEGQLYLYYFDTHCIGEYDFPLPANARFSCTVIDTQAMTKEKLPGLFTGRAKGKATLVDENAGEQVQGGSNHLKLSGQPYQAVVFQKV